MPIRLRDTVTFEQFHKIVRPSFHKDVDEEDLVGVFKRSTFIIFTNAGRHVRVQGTDRTPVPQYAWTERDIGMISPSTRPLLAAYKRGNLSHMPADHDVEFELAAGCAGWRGLVAQSQPFSALGVCLSTTCVLPKKARQQHVLFFRRV